MPTQQNHNEAPQNKRRFPVFPKKHWKAVLLSAIDLSLLPAFFFCRWLSDFMLAQHGVCAWTMVGAQCGTCGGTRCVYNLLRGNFTEAFSFNPFVFACAVYAAVSLILLHLAWLCRIGWTQKVLRKMYSLTAILIAIGTFVLFIVVRNIPFFIRLFTLIAERL